MLRAFFIILLSLIAPIYGAEDERPAHSLQYMYIKSLLVLTGFIGMLYGAVYYIKKLGYYPSEGNIKDAIHIKERKALSSKTSLWLVEVRNHKFLIVDNTNHVSITPFHQEES